jgi:Ca2+-binding RTX toxin-like protein
MLSATNTPRKIENLEARTLFDAVEPAWPAVMDASGVITVTGTDGNDSVLFGNYRVGSLRVLRVMVNQLSTDFEDSAVTAIKVDVKGGDDLACIGRRSVPVTLVGGAGNDSLSAGNGNDKVYGGPGNDYLFGRDGNDTLDGGTGGDEMLGGNEVDTVDYSARNTSLYVGVGEHDDDGEAGEHDNVRGDVEVVLGGKGNDHLTTIYHDGRPLELVGGAGIDTLGGVNGADTLLMGTRDIDKLPQVAAIPTAQ